MDDPNPQRQQQQLQQQQLQQQPPRANAGGDVVLRCHAAVRRALVDLGDEILDCVIDGLGESYRNAVEGVRREKLDPLRKKNG
jgi:hypothetical protein